MSAPTHIVDVSPDFGLSFGLTRRKKYPDTYTNECRDEGEPVQTTGHVARDNGGACAARYQFVARAFARRQRARILRDGLLRGRGALLLRGAQTLGQGAEAGRPSSNQADRDQVTILLLLRPAFVIEFHSARNRPPGGA